MTDSDFGDTWSSSYAEVKLKRRTERSTEISSNRHNTYSAYTHFILNKLLENILHTCLEKTYL